MGSQGCFCPKNQAPQRPEGMLRRKNIALIRFA
jgi:hypothetical protein